MPINLIIFLRVRGWWNEFCIPKVRLSLERGYAISGGLNVFCNLGMNEAVLRCFRVLILAFFSHFPLCVQEESAAFKMSFAE